MTFMKGTPCRRIISWLLVSCFVVIVFSMSILLIRYSAHECTGITCPICNKLIMAQKQSMEIRDSLLSFNAAILYTVFFIFTILKISYANLEGKEPVLANIRLNI